MAREDERWHPVAPENWANQREHSRKIAQVLNGAMQGRTNNRGRVTLTATGVQTALADIRIGATSIVVLQPFNEAARNLLPNATSYTDGGCTLYHTAASLSSSASTTTGGGALPIYDYVVFS